MTYAEAIKALRKKMLITRTELAAQLGVAFVSVNRWENGAYEPTMMACQTCRLSNKQRFGGKDLWMHIRECLF